MRETLVARGVIPASWMERIYKHSSKQSIAGRSRFQHSAVMVLARDAARACAADRSANLLTTSWVLIEVADALHWQKLSAAPCTVRTFSGGHFYLQSHWQELAEHLTRTLAA